MKRSTNRLMKVEVEHQRAHRRLAAGERGSALFSFSHLRACDNVHQFGDFSSLIGLVAGRNGV